MEKCNCNGLNSDCFFCGGMGYFEPIEKQTFNIKAANSKNSKLNSKSKDEIQTKNPKKTKPSEIILNHINYSKQTFEKLRSFLKEKIKYEYALPNIKKNETKIKLYNQQISDIERIVFFKMYFNPKKKTENNKKFLKIEIKKKISKNLKNKKSSKNIVFKKNDSTDTAKIGDLFSLGLIKKLKK